MSEKISLKDDELYQIAKSAFEHAFLSDEEKQVLFEQFFPISH